MSIKMTAAAILASMVSALPAQASPLQFTFTDPAALAGTQVVSFVLDSNPTPTTFDRSTFAVSVLDATLNGIRDSALDTMSFADSTTDGSLSSGDILFAFSPQGLQLFAGDTSNPIFSVGSFALLDPDTSGAATLDVSPLSAAPEPSTWALMLAGVGLAGWALRRRTSQPALG